MIIAVSIVFRELVELIYFWELSTRLVKVMLFAGVQPLTDHVLTVQGCLRMSVSVLVSALMTKQISAQQLETFMMRIPSQLVLLSMRFLSRTV